MKVGFIYDQGNADGTLGGAELTMSEFIGAAPEGVDFDWQDAPDVIVVGNCVNFSPAETIERLKGKKVYRYHNDLARHEHPALREWLRFNATHIYTSPMHRDLYGGKQGPHIPPALDLDRLKPNRQARRHGKRKGACSIAAWQNPGKGQRQLAEWAEKSGTPVDVFGTGALAPTGGLLSYQGPLDYANIPRILWSYETFVFLPTEPEPFGRCVVEAHFAECEVVTNKKVGARHYIEKDPDALTTAAEDFWKLVLS